MPSPESKLPETRERRCPACQSEDIAPVGHVVAGDGLIRVQHRCEACGIAFRFVRKPLI
jgi:predicted Zn-ribbon and HTH transcriptional regulator